MTCLLYIYIYIGIRCKVELVATFLRISSVHRCLAVKRQWELKITHRGNLVESFVVPPTTPLKQGPASPATSTGSTPPRTTCAAARKCIPKRVVCTSGGGDCTGAGEDPSRASPGQLVWSLLLWFAVDLAVVDVDVKIAVVVASAVLIQFASS